MTYVMKLWDPLAAGPVQDLNAAMDAVERLEDRSPGPNRKFVALADSLNRRFPGNDSPAGAARSPLERAWTDGSVRGDGDDAVLVLGLLTSMLDEVRPFVIAEASKFGLGVLDEQAGEAFLPGGVRLVGDAVQRMAAPAVECAPTGRELQAKAFELLAPVLGPSGFKARKSDLSFKRSFTGGWQRLELVIEDRSPVYSEFAFLTSLRLDAIGELQETTFPLARRAKDGPTTWLRQGNWQPVDQPFIEANLHRYRVRALSELATVIEYVTARWQSVLEPILREMTTVEGFDRILNTEPLSASLFFDAYMGTDSNVLAAYLAGNPRLEAICRECLDKASDETRSYLAPCVEYVRRHPLA